MLFIHVFLGKSSDFIVCMRDMIPENVKVRIFNLKDERVPAEFIHFHQVDRHIAVSYTLPEEGYYFLTVIIHQKAQPIFLIEAGS